MQDYEHCADAPSWILAELLDGGRGRDGDLLARVDSVCLYRATTISASDGARVLARTHASASVPGAPLIATAAHGAGRVVVLADSDLFGDDCIDEFDHRALWLNIVYWVARTPARAPLATADTRLDPAWAELRDQTNALAAATGRRRVARAATATARRGARRRDRRGTRAA